MASTRNRNTPLNYRQEVRLNQTAQQWQLYAHGAGGTNAGPTHWAGNGLLQGHLPRSELSYNPVEIESYLFGIGSTNLVEPQAPLTPRLKCLTQANLYETPAVLMPVPLVVPKNQRPQAP